MAGNDQFGTIRSVFASLSHDHRKDPVQHETDRRNLIQNPLFYSELYL